MEITRDVSGLPDVFVMVRGDRPVGDGPAGVVTSMTGTDELLAANEDWVRYGAVANATNNPLPDYKAEAERLGKILTEVRFQCHYATNAQGWRFSDARHPLFEKIWPLVVTFENPQD